MRSQSPYGLDDALKAVAANTTARNAHISRLAAYVKGDQYDGRPNWFDAAKPLLERAPCIIYPSAKNAIRSNVAMCLGEGKFPRITSSPGEDGEDLDDDLGLNEDNSATLDAFINGPLKRHTRLATVAREMLRRAQGEQTSAVVICARGGRISVDTFAAKTCTPTFVENGRPNEVCTIEILYPYLYEYWDDVRNTWAVRALLFRRVIDDKRDVTYLPMVAPETGEEIASDLWREDASRTVEHKLGRCPVIWYPHGGRTDDGVDGSAVHEDLLDEIDALNISLSQRHRAAIYSGDPQVVEIGVDPDHEPAIDGNTAVVYIEQDEKGGTYRSAKHFGVTDGGTPARRKGAGTVWRYPATDTKVALLTLPTGALESIDNDAKDIKAKLDESLSVVFLDPGNSALRIGELSGSAIRKLYMRQTANCDEVREDFGENCLLQLVDMLLWFIATVVGRDEGIKIMGLKKVAPILAKFIDKDGCWSTPELFLKWGNYFDDSAKDELDVVRVAAEAKAGGFISLENAVEKVAPLFDIKSTHELAESLEAKANEQSAALHSALNEHAESTPVTDDAATDTA